MSIRSHLLLALFLLCSTLGGRVSADGELPKLLSAADQTRLQRFDVVRAEALAAARAGGAAADHAQLEAALAGDASPLQGVDVAGDWQCRTFKLGKTLPLVVYGWFRCRIDDDGAGWRLRKLDGSQRTAGRFYDIGNDRMVYLGVSTLGGQRPVSYGSDPQRDQVAIAVVPGRDRLRLEFPLPQFDSMFDVMELRRPLRGAEPAPPAAVAVPGDSAARGATGTKRVTGVVRSVEPGDRACLLRLEDESGQPFEELADFRICEQGRGLRGRRVALRYASTELPAADCGSDETCSRRTRVDLVVGARPVADEAGSPASRNRP
jgi:hypothetical protein